jgi:hypothetical protein
VEASLGFVMENVGKVFEEDDASPGSVQIFDSRKNVFAS